MRQRIVFILILVTALLTGCKPSTKRSSESSATTSSGTVPTEINSANTEAVPEVRTRSARIVQTKESETITLPEPPAAKELSKEGIVVFSDDNLHIGWTIPTTNGRWVAAIDGQTGPAYDQIRYIVLSHDGTRFAYTAKNGEEWFAVIDGQEEPHYDGISIGSPIFSSDCHDVAYGAMKDNKWFLVLNGLSLGYQCEDIGPVLFSPDGRHIIHTALINGRWTVMIDGEVESDYEHIYKLTPESEAVEYMADRDGWFFRCRRSYPSTNTENQKPHSGNLTEQKLYRSNP